MSKFRRAYYNIFSKFYDLIINLHSRDEGASLRGFLVKSAGIKEGHIVMDMCSGTGSVVLQASKAVGEKGMVVAVDFSHGMLTKAKEKVNQHNLKNVYLIEADVSKLPFKKEVFDEVTCSHAMYELKADVRRKALAEINTCLKQDSSFYMMEHEKPKNPIIKFLYYVRLFSMGSIENRVFAKDEVGELEKYFVHVKKSLSPTKKSKLLSGEKRVTKLLR